MKSIANTLQRTLQSGLLALLLSIVAHAEQNPAATEAYPSVQAITTQSGDRVGKTVVFEGFVTGVCRNGGKKVFIHDRNRELQSTIRVDRTNEQPAFEPSLVGKSIRVTGILRELRIDTAYLDSWEAKVTGKPAATEAAKASTVTDHCTEACGASEGQKKTLKRIAALRERVSKADTGYISSFWVDGISWEALNK